MEKQVGVFDSILVEHVSLGLVQVKDYVEAVFFAP